MFLTKNKSSEKILMVPAATKRVDFEGVCFEDRVGTFVGLYNTVGTIFLVLRIVFGSIVIFSLIVGVLYTITVEM